MPATRFLPLLLITAIAVAFAWQLAGKQADSSPARTTDPALQRPMPTLHLPILNSESTYTPSDAGGAYLLNVFASWCAACRIEHGQLLALKQQSGLPLYGMAWKDKPENTTRWLEEMGNIYDVVMVDADGRAAIDIGLTGAPETYMVSADGVILAVYRGALSASVIEQIFLPAMQAMEPR